MKVRALLLELRRNVENSYKALLQSLEIHGRSLASLLF